MGRAHAIFGTISNPANIATAVNNTRTQTGLNRHASGAGANMNLMHRNATRAMVAIVLLICVVCPMVELFDYWDHTIQTGNDTEYTLVLLALCVGIVFTLVRFSVALFSKVAACNA